MSHRLLLAALLGACTGPAPFQPGLDTDTDTDAGTDSDPFWPEDTDPLSRVDEDGDGVPASKDCNDLNPLVNPSQTEKCNGADDDCDGQIDQSDEPFSGATGPYFRDEDIDGFGAETSKRFFCSAPNDWTLKGGDCDDTRASIRPGAVEICDDVDNDCDGLTDGEDLDLNVQGSPDAVFRYVDGDGDGVGDGDGQWLCFEPAQGWADDDGDCDDTNPLVNPSASETCNGLDDDCNGKIDADDSGIDASLVEWGHRDADGDGFGTTSTSSSNRQRFCKGALPSGWVLDNTDCDDSRDTRFPGNPEICDKGIDNDCDNKVDAADDSVRQSDLVQLWRDADSDTFGTPSNTQMACDNARPSGWVTNAQDCDDTRNAVKPGATEICNSLDDDCDLKTDDEDDSVNVTNPWLIDKDGDGYPDTADKRVQCTKPGANAYPTSGSGSKAADCDDDDIDTWPGAAENESGSSCRQDRDKDGYGAKVPAKAGVTAGTDCDDTQYTTRPGAEDAWYDGVDADCGGEDDYDQDGDGERRRPEANDCDDTVATVLPGADEVCDDIDNDCDDKIDEADPGLIANVWFLDEDGDGWAGRAVSLTQCDRPTDDHHLSTELEDCDDDDLDTYPGAAELESEVLCMTDGDGDGYGAEVVEAGVQAGLDCVDDDDTINPEAFDIPQNEIDEDCSGADSECDYGDETCPAVDCQDLKLVRPDAPTGVYWLMPPGTATKMQARCEMTVAGGGYTLVMISANDGANRWTWSNASYWGTSTTSFGDPNNLYGDYRAAPLINSVPMRDVLFIHRPSSKYAEYRLVGTEQSLGSWMTTNMASPRCYGSGTGIPLRSGTITTSSTTLCSTSLMWNAQDQDGSTTCQSNSSTRAWGFHWSAYNGQACPLDDPSRAGLGPESGSTTVEMDAIGFGRALGLNTGIAGTGSNRMEIYVRR
ncbi:MAG: hypothetical protein H6732_19765 [Alphaproteobacteria bacterium]|nr:hypothetical protein [Alphaproteobacteria bacterium]